MVSHTCLTLHILTLHYSLVPDLNSCYPWVFGLSINASGKNCQSSSTPVRVQIPLFFVPRVPHTYSCHDISHCVNMTCFLVCLPHWTKDSFRRRTVALYRNAQHLLGFQLRLVEGIGIVSSSPKFKNFFLKKTKNKKQNTLIGASLVAQW